jgi:hypothetical protein
MMKGKGLRRCWGGARSSYNVIPVYLSLLCSARLMHIHNLKERRNFKPLFKATLPRENLRRIIWAERELLLQIIEARI